MDRKPHSPGLEVAPEVSYSGQRKEWGKSRHLAVAALWLGGLLLVLMLTADLDRTKLGIATIMLAIVMILGGIPIAFSLMGTGLVGLYVLGGLPVVNASLSSIAYDTAASWSLSVIPLFIAMGVMLGSSGLTAAAYQAARVWLGFVPGGLAVGSTLAGAGLAASSGSTVGISYALGRVAIPEMLRSGYKVTLATGVVAMAGTMGQVIPPSVMLVLYAGIAETAVGPQLLAGIVPGVLLTLGFSLLIVVRCTINPSLAGGRTSHSFPWRVKLRGLAQSMPLLAVIVTVVGGLMTGVVTPTEAGALGFLVAVGMSVFSSGGRRLPAVMGLVWKSAKEAALASSAIFLLLIGAALLKRVVALSGLAQILAEAAVTSGLGRVGFLIVLIGILILLGMFLDPMAILLLTIPVISPVLAALDIDLIWFGVFMIIVTEMAIVTPPIGILCFIIHRIAQDPEVGVGHDIGLVDVFRGVLPFVGVAIGVLLILIYFPELALFFER